MSKRTNCETDLENNVASTFDRGK